MNSKVNSPMSPPFPLDHSPFTTPHGSTDSVASLSQTILRPPKQQKPRRSITATQAIDAVQLGMTQALDLQHLFEKYTTQIEVTSNTLSRNIDDHFNHIIKQLNDRKETLKQQVNGWKSDKLFTVSTEIANASEFEEKFCNIQNQCDAVLRKKKLDEKQKRKQIKTIQRAVLNTNDIDLQKYNNSKELIKYINHFTSLIGVEYEDSVSSKALPTYGQITTKPNHELLTIPVVTLCKPIKGKDTHNEYKMKLKWSTSEPLIAKCFVVRCLATHINDDDEKAAMNEWKSLKFACKTNKRCTEFRAEINATFVFDVRYTFRVKYHMTEPVNLMIKSNEVSYEIADVEPSTAKVNLIDLEYHSSNGYSYEGHPKHLLSEDTANKYRSKHNKDFDYTEHDWIVFKLKHSGFIRTYLPKMTLITNNIGAQALRELVLSIGSEGSGKKWHKYELIELENNAKEQQVLLKGVDWKIIKQMKTQFIKLELMRNYGESRGAQCKFKVQQFHLYGMEFE
eukprot:50159_1